MTRAKKRKPEKKIEFTFEGREYVVPETAFYSDRIALPDDRILDVVWGDADPPQPEELRIYGLTLTTLKSYGQGMADNIPVAKEIK